MPTPTPRNICKFKSQLSVPQSTPKLSLPHISRELSLFLLDTMFRTLPYRQVQLYRTFATHAAATPSRSVNPVTRHDWKKAEIQEIYDTPLLDLVFRSASVHRQHHDPNKIQLCTLMNIKSASCVVSYSYPNPTFSFLSAGGCTEDCQHIQYLNQQRR
jgi:hypothetical protein